MWQKDLKKTQLSFELYKFGVSNYNSPQNLRSFNICTLQGRKVMKLGPNFMNLFMALFDRWVNVHICHCVRTNEFYIINCLQHTQRRSHPNIRTLDLRALFLPTGKNTPENEQHLVDLKLIINYLFIEWRKVKTLTEIDFP